MRKEYQMKAYDSLKKRMLEVSGYKEPNTMHRK